MTSSQLIPKTPPKQLFLIDACGALLSAFLLGVILVKFENIFGMPRRELYFLAALAGGFVIYSLSCYLLVKENWSLFLAIIGSINLLYCGLTAGLVLRLYQDLTVLGITYFVLEIIIVVSLAMIELETAFGLR